MSDLNVDDIATVIAEQIRSHAVELLGDESYCFAIWKAIKLRLPVHHAGAPRLQPGQGEGRWMARLLMFNANGDLAADSQPNDHVTEADPREMLPTIRAVGEWARQSAEAFHAAENDPPPQGLDEATLAKRILSLRVQLSRTKANFVWWKLPYLVGEQQWQINVRVGKATLAQVLEGQAPEAQSWRTPATERTASLEPFPGSEQ